MENVHLRQALKGWAHQQNVLNGHYGTETTPALTAQREQNKPLIFSSPPTLHSKLVFETRDSKMPGNHPAAGLL